MLTDEVERRFARPRYALATIASLEVMLQYGCSRRATKEPVGVPILRMNNLQAVGWDLSDLKYVELTDKEFANWRLESGDIVFNRTNSKELVGKCEVFEMEGDWIFASYLMRLRVDVEKIVPEFLSAFLNMRAGRVQIDRLSRQIIGMSNINAVEIRTLCVPLPNLSKQRELLATLDAARVGQLDRLREAEDLLSGLDDFVLEALGLTAPAPHDPSMPFAVRLKTIRGGRLDPPAFTPFPIPSNPRQIPIERLSQVADINTNIVQPPKSGDALVPYVGLPECNLNDVREVVTRSYKVVKGRSVVHLGDILFARIEPSIFNKKYVLADYLGGYDHAYLSTEFYTVRAHGDKYDQRYLYAILLS